MFVGQQAPTEGKLSMFLENMLLGEKDTFVAELAALFRFPRGGPLEEMVSDKM